MAADDQLIFWGTRWQAARATSIGATLFEVTASGSGRQWQADVSLGFWRDFASIALDDAEVIAGFVQRYGDPHGTLTRRQPIHTGHWKNLSAVLGAAARGWEPEDVAGVSQITADAQRLRHAEWFIRDSGLPILKDIELEFRGTRVVKRAKTLATFMCLSAASALERRVPMRRCARCGSWFELTRRDTRFCSGSCRAFHSQQRKEK